MPKDKQTERLGLRVTKRERRMLATISKWTGLTESSVLRTMIHRRFAEVRIEAGGRVR